MELDEEKWNEGFEGLEECFEYVTGMRFFRPEQFKREGLKSNDRQRLNSRGMYREFVDVWVRKFEDPTVKEDGTEEPCLTGREDLIVKEDYSTTSKFPTTKDHSSPSSHATTNPKREDITRTSVTNEVLTLFNKQKEFDENRKVWEEERAELKEKWYAKERRREVYNEEKVYADAWIVWLVDGNSRGG